ncbi:uncharacterized protein [Acropora muricata]|uniref:uncharacterized protein LOC114976558 n=1 Tax=Acropora millepora TaxID=45264 RepID=UPI0010FC886A|nr:uncharacterized protein LOC114976558 [Acropora millepora]
MVALENVPCLFRLPILPRLLVCSRNVSFLSPLTCFQTIAMRDFHQTSRVDRKYHHLEKKRKLRKRRTDQLRARLQRLDEEDRPTGCLLCPMRNDIEINYKNVRLLSQFISPHTGRIYGRTLTGLCNKKQTEISGAIRRARAMGFMPVTMKYLAFHDDPKLF